jgi:hypothetical protein
MKQGREPAGGPQAGQGGHCGRPYAAITCLGSGFNPTARFSPSLMPYITLTDRPEA